MATNESVGNDTIENSEIGSESTNIDLDRTGSEAETYELFEKLYNQFADDVLRVSYFYLGDRGKAEDVCQDVFVRLLTRTPDIKPGHEKAWLLKVALNRCRDLWRAAWVKRVVLGSPFDCIPAPDDIEFRTEKTDLMEAVSKLPPAFKEVILLHYYQGFGITEISMMLDLPEGTISSRLSRARKKLETLLRGSQSALSAQQTQNSVRSSGSGNTKGGNRKDPTYDLSKDMVEDLNRKNASDDKSEGGDGV